MYYIFSTRQLLNINLFSTITITINITWTLVLALLLRFQITKLLLFSSMYFILLYFYNISLQMYWICCIHVILFICWQCHQFLLLINMLINSIKSLKYLNIVFIKRKIVVDGREGGGAEGGGVQLQRIWVMLWTSMNVKSWLKVKENHFIFSFL